LSPLYIPFIFPFIAGISANKQYVNSANAIYRYRFFLPFPKTLSSISLVLNTITVNANLGFAIFNVNLQKVADSGAIPIDASMNSTVRTFNLLSTVTLPAGEYWIAWTTDTATAANTTNSFNGFTGNNQDTLLNITEGNLGIDSVSSVAGAIPNTLGILTPFITNSVNSFIPIMRFN
jgi:hypothetical protein